MASGVRFVDNSVKVKKEMEKAIAEALNRIGIIWLNHVTEIINTRYGRPIVDTGRLRASMQFKVDVSKKQVIVGSDVDYAIFVELGTIRMNARPMVKPAVMEYIKEYEAAVKQVLGGGWSVSAAMSY